MPLDDPVEGFKHPETPALEDVGIMRENDRAKSLSTSQPFLGF